MARVLVVDDDPGIRALLRRALESQGHEVAVAPTGMEGLRRALSDDFGLIILDLGLPDLPGLAVLSALADAGRAQRVLVLSANGGADDRVTCFERGAVDFVPKPFALRELLARVRSRAAGPALPPGDRAPDILVAGCIRLDLLRRQARVDGTTVELSPREFRVLEHLMRSGGRICSREELLTEVWGYASGAGSNVVDVTMRRLRTKLGDRANIETVRHAGYCLA